MTNYSYNELLIVIVHEDENSQEIERTLKDIREQDGYQECFAIIVSDVFNYSELGSMEAILERSKFTLAKIQNISEKCNNVLFVFSGCELEEGLISNCLAYDQKSNLVVFRESGYNYRLNKSLSSGRKVLVEADSGNIFIAGNGLFISTDLLSKLLIDFSVFYLNPIEQLFIQAAYLNMGFETSVKKINSNKLFEDKINELSLVYKEEWYFDFAYFWKNILNVYSSNNYLPVFFQKVYLYCLQQRLACNINANNKTGLWDRSVDSFLKLCGDVLVSVNDELILKRWGYYTALNLRFRMFLYKIKESSNSNIYAVGDLLVLSDNANVLSHTKKTKLEIELMSYSNGVMEIAGCLPAPFNTADYGLRCQVNGKEHPLIFNDRYSSLTCMGIEIYNNKTFSCFLELRLFDVPIEISFYIEYKSTHYPLSMVFNKSTSKLSTVNGSYWSTNDFICSATNHKILLEKYNNKQHFKKEIIFLKNILKTAYHKKNKMDTLSFCLRVIYWITRPWYKRKKIWLYFDKTYKAGDNAEYAYKYAAGVKDSINKYYVLRDDSHDAARFKKEGLAYLKYNSLKHRLLFLNTSLVFSTHPSIPAHNRFTKSHEKYFRDLFNYKSVCIQHGLSVQDSRSFLNRVKDGLNYFSLASSVEKNNLLMRGYDYKAEHLVINGLARYDGLISNDKKKILITPTWRSYLAVPAKMGKSREYNSLFRDSDYFRLYSSLISNNILKNTARKYGYKIMFLLHPVTSSQKGDFEVFNNDVVDVIAATDDVSYEKLLTESSLMVTDYSGVQFDFAYMYKPIVYFHPKELPPSYEEGYYNYETMALGEIVDNLEGLILTLCEYMKSGCEMKDFYRKRVDSFFVYHDHKNSERIYDFAAKEFVKKNG